MARTILVVEDDPTLRETLAEALETEGFRTIQAADGREALVSFRADTPDLVLLDLMMPEMDGITFLKMLRRSPLWKDMPVIVLTGVNDDDKLITRAWELKVNDLIPKASFGFEDLLARVRQHLPVAAG
jgi:DNA-binding response OmpR family regulator